MYIPNLTEDQVDAINNGFEENILKYKNGENGWYEEYLEEMGYYLDRIAVGNFKLRTDCEAGKGPSSTDFENAVTLYEALDVTPAVASSGGFWTAMVHSNMNYMAFRWPADTDTESTVKSHYLIDWSTNRRERERNGLSRLWWGVYLTVDKSLGNDKYLLTRELFSSQDLLTQVLDRESFNRDVARAFMRVLVSERQDGRALDRNETRAVMKHLYALDRSLVLFALDEKTVESKLLEYLSWYRSSENRQNA